MEEAALISIYNRIYSTTPEEIQQANIQNKSKETTTSASITKKSSDAK